MANFLLIEDNPNNAEYIIRILAGMGHEVDHYIMGVEGGLAARKHDYDMILVDFNLPDIDGSVLALTLKKSTSAKHIPIVAVTARNTHLDRMMAQKFGCDAFVGKPFEPEELIDVVDQLLAASTQDTGEAEEEPNSD
jgi:DNA-binding response OmpR family regulator